MKLSNQQERVIRYCKENGSITSWEAMKELGVARLASRMCELRCAFNIVDEWVEDINRYGETVRYKRYKILGRLNAENMVL